MLQPTTLTDVGRPVWWWWYNQLVLPHKMNEKPTSLLACSFEHSPLLHLHVLEDVEGTLLTNPYSTHNFVSKRMAGSRGPKHIAHIFPTTYIACFYRIHRYTPTLTLEGYSYGYTYSLRFEQWQRKGMLVREREDPSPLKYVRFNSFLCVCLNECKLKRQRK